MVPHKMAGDSELAIRVVQYALTFGLTAWLVNRFRRAKFRKPAERSDGTQVIKPSMGMWLLAYGGIAFWIALIIISTLHPGQTKDLRGPHAVFAFFALLSAFLAYTCHASRVTWDEASISGPTWYGKQLTFKWSDVDDCKYNASMQAITITNCQNQTIWISEYMEGVKALSQFLQARFPKATMFLSSRYAEAFTDENS